MISYILLLDSFMISICDNFNLFKKKSELNQTKFRQYINYYYYYYYNYYMKKIIIIFVFAFNL